MHIVYGFTDMNANCLRQPGNMYLMYLHLLIKVTSRKVKATARDVASQAAGWGYKQQLIY